MDREKLLSEMSIVLEMNVSELCDDYDLKGHGLDSLAVVSIIAAIDINYGVRIQGCDMEKCTTVKDVLNLIELKR